MRRSVLPALALCLAAPAVAAGRAQDTPVQKVISLLTGMLQKGKEAKHAEEVQFATFKQFCDDTSVQKQRDVQAAEERIEFLKAEASKLISDAARLTKEVAAHDEDISVWTGDKKAATQVRELEDNDYKAMHKDYTESLDALTRAVAVLKQQAKTRPQASLAQVAALKGLRLIPAEAKKAIDLFLAQDADVEPAEGTAVTAPEANGYEFQSQGVIDILEKLHDKFVDERTSLEKQEMNAKHAYELLMQDLAAQISSATEDRGVKAVQKAKKLQAKADAEGDLSDTTTMRDSDKKYLDNLVASCEQKASDFETRQQLRAEELQALDKAMEILSSSAVSGNAEKHLPQLLQKRRAGAALSQFRAQGRSPTQERVATFLRDQARHLNSRVLSAIATHVMDDPFQKVKKMIKDLLVRLMEEANEEAEHKGWCDAELGTNEQTRKEKTAAVETLHAEIDQLEASIAKLTEEVTELSEAVAEIDAAVAKATELRQEEKAENEKTVTDSQAAQTAVAQALTVLKEFYEKAGEATALVQRQPEIFDSPYKGMQGEKGGVVGMLEVIESDFARLEADTKAAEAAAQKEYDTFMTDSKVDKAAKVKDIEHKEAKKQDDKQALTTTREDLQGTQKELDAALAYFDKLKPSCVDAGVSYEDRVARRQAEIESLQEALRILSGEDIA